MSSSLPSPRPVRLGCDAVVHAITDTRAVPPGWRILMSDAGRYWATREQQFTREQMAAGAARTVDGDTLPELCRAIAEQEAIATLSQAS